MAIIGNILLLCSEEWLFVHPTVIIGNILLLYSEEWLFVCPMVIISWLPTHGQWRPVKEASESGPLRGTLPTEVVMVSMYVMPVASSLTMQLILIVEIPGITTSPMGKVHLH